MKKTIKILSVILATIMFFSVFSAANPVFASELQNAEVENVVSDVNETAEESVEAELEEIEEAPEIIGEDLSRRDETTKHFIMSDGTRKAVKYSNPVHFEKDGEWVDIDNTLFYDETKGEYTNTENSFKVAFNEELKNENLFTIENEGYTLSWEYKSDAMFKKNPEAEVESTSENDDLYLERVEKTNSAISYNEFEADSTLEYVVTSNGVKENIIISSPTNKNEFEFKVVAPGLNLIKNANGSISARAEDNSVKFYIPAPYMFDSAEGYSEDVEYTLTQTDDDTYTITVIADKEWLNDEARVYPVTIDPAVQTKQNKKDITSTFIASGMPNTNFNNMQDVYIGVESSNYLKCRALFEFTLPTLGKGDMVVGASLALLQYATSFYNGNMPKQQLNAYLVTENWSASSVTWNTQPAYNGTVLDYSFLKSNVNEWKSFDITRAVKGWYEGTYANHGILIKKEVESGANEDVAARGIFWSDKNNGVDEYYPYIEVTYRNNKGLEGYWSYSSFSKDSCGVGSVNDYSGNLVYQIPIASTVSEIMPVSLSLVYNSYAARDVYTSGKNGSYLTTPGRGWKLNIQETLLPSTQYGLTGDSAEQYPYVYTDGDGTEHYIQKVTKKENDKEVITYEDEDGLGLTLDPEATNTYTYKLTDKQDNEWYFNAKGNLGYMKDANGNTINIYFKDTDGDGTREKDKIDYIKDGTGHTLSFTYYENTNYVKTITDNAGRVITFNTVNGRLNSVGYYDGSLTYIDYEDIKKSTGEIDPEIALINFVWSSDRVGVNFDYTSSQTGYRVKKVKEFAATAVYPSVEDYVPGQVVTFDRTRYNTTVIRSGGIDGVTYDTSTDTTTSQTAAKRYDDIVTTLQFDNFGRPVSQQVSYGNGAEVGAGAYNYQNKEGSENKITDAASLGKNTVNMLKNGTCESFSGWVQNTNVADASADHYTVTGIQYSGTNALAVRNIHPINTAVNTNYGQEIDGWTAGNTYTLSAFVRTLNLTKLNKGGLEGAYLQITETKTTGTKTYYSQVLTEDTNISVNNGWRRLSVSFTPDENTTKVTVFLCLRNATGNAYFDDAQFEKGTTPNAVNLLLNSSFEAESDGLPVGWAKRGSADYEKNSSNTVLTGVTSAAHKDGAKSLIISGSANAYKGFSQTIPVQGNPNDTYILSGWAAAYAVNSTFHSHYEKDGEEPTDDELREILESADKEDDKTLDVVEDSKFEIAVTVYYNKTDKNGNTQTEPVPQDKDPVKFNTTVADWQYASTPIVLKYEKEAGDECTYTPTSIEIMPRYNLQANYAYFDHIQLIKDVAQSYVYDKEGNLVSVSANAEQKNNMKYDGEDNLTEYYDAGYNKTTFEYQEDTHNLTKVTSPKGVKTEYSYNSVGLNTVAETVDTEGNDKIKTTTAHTGEYKEDGYTINAGAYIRYSNDENGYTTAYEYDMPTGVVKSVTSPNGLITTNTYTNNFGKLSSVNAGGTSVSYAYSNNRINSIVFEDVGKTFALESYGFVYNSHGDVITTNVGGKTLVTNTYKANDGVLERSTYANGDAVSYDYTYAGLTSAVYQHNNGENDKPAYTWQYSSNGTPRMHQDGYANLRYNYSYDSIGRLIRTDISDSTNGTAIGSTEFGYNTRGHQTSVTNEIGGRTYEQQYVYSKLDGVEGSFENASDGLSTRYGALGKAVDYSYDGLNRLTYRSQNTTTPLTNEYSYAASLRGTGYTTTLISEEKINGVSFAYTYDKMGNISTIKRGGTNYHSYEYDLLGQLVRDNSYTSGGGTYVWDYDGLGNILSKTKYAYTPGSLSGLTPIQTIDYEYGTSNINGWNNLLKSVDLNGNDDIDENEEILYDSIGNPTTYLGATMSWFGRQLRTYSKNGISANFMYDADGLRSAKGVNGVKTTYQYVGDKLFYEKRGSNIELYYFYDSYGKLSAISYVTNGTATPFYVSTNAQGDVLSIHTSSGVKVAQYDYDAWGNATVMVVTTDSDGKYVYTTVTDESAPGHISTLNPIRYRGYYYDEDLELYYLQSRYYDAEIGRFINADTMDVLSVSFDGVTDKNLFSYCDNNPVVRGDCGGQVWETVLDVASLGVSVVEVAINPADVWAWAGLVGDAVDLIPFVTGVGEVTRAIKTFNKADEVVDAAKALKRNIPSSVGTYEVLFKSGKNYVGKGSFERAITSAIEHCKPNKLNDGLGDVVTSIKWKKSSSAGQAFMEEFGLQTFRGVGNKNTYNIIWSPGKKLYDIFF